MVTDTWISVCSHMTKTKWDVASLVTGNTDQGFGSHPQAPFSICQSPMPPSSLALAFSINLKYFPWIPIPIATMTKFLSYQASVRTLQRLPNQAACLIPPPSTTNFSCSDLSKTQISSPDLLLQAQAGGFPSVYRIKPGVQAWQSFPISSIVISNK